MRHTAPAAMYAGPIGPWHLGFALVGVGTAWLFATPLFAASLALGAVLEAINFRTLRRNCEKIFSGMAGAGARSGIAAVAECPNVTVKLGGIGMPRTGFDWHLRDKPIGSEELSESMAPFINYCIEQFGANRCMFESNFPVDKVSFSYHVMYNAFKRLSKGYSATERADLFHDTAARVYRIDV